MAEREQFGETERVRLAEVLASLAMAIDLGLGVASETMLRTALVAVRLGGAAGLDEDDVLAAFQLAFLRFVGCSTTSHETSLVMGDELGIGDILVATDAEMMPLFTSALLAGKSEAEGKASVERTFAAMGAGLFLRNHETHCEAARLIAIRMGLGTAVQEGLLHAYERWDGQNLLRRAEGEAISLPMRVVHVALLAGMESPRRPAEWIATRAKLMAGNQLDPGLAALLAEDTGYFIAGLDGSDLTQAVIVAEPGEPIWLSGASIDTCLTAIADFGDFKSPHMLGHSRRVAQVATKAARAASLPDREVCDIGRAALIHDVGRVGVQAQLLSKSGGLTRTEHERIRMHSYLTGRIFANSPVLGPIGLLGSSHHERQDGSGYHRGLTAPALPANARLLAAANAWCALTEARPHRPQMTEAEAATSLSTQAKAGLFDRRAVDAVLTAAGKKGAQSRRASSSKLSEREIEVLHLVSREQTNLSIAESLGISHKTVERHVTHIYDKLGVTTRAGAAIYALENGLL